jgi:hypothetical protein
MLGPLERANLFQSVPATTILSNWMDKDVCTDQGQPY